MLKQGWFVANLVSELVAVCVRRQVFEGRWASLSGLAEDVRRACGGCALLASRLCVRWAMAYVFAGMGVEIWRREKVCWVVDASLA